MTEHESFPMTIVVAGEDAGTRLDRFLAGRLSRWSRVLIRSAIESSEVLVDSRPAKPSFRLSAGQSVLIRGIPSRTELPTPEPLELDILFEDDAMVVVNKPAAMVVHPAKGHWQGTLVAGLAHHFQHLSSIGGAARPGIVHRLDRDTTGVIVVAKTDEAHLSLAKQFEQRSVQKEYLAVVSPPPDRDQDWIDAPIGVHPKQREKMAIRPHDSAARTAQTFYRVDHRSGRFACVTVMPKTGRTHQIRVHFAHVGHPIVADKLYAGHSELRRCDLDPDSTDIQPVIQRQALHASTISLNHPLTGERISISAPIPDDLRAVMTCLGASIGEGNA